MSTPALRPPPTGTSNTAHGSCSAEAPACPEERGFRNGCGSGPWELRKAAAWSLPARLEKTVVPSHICTLRLPLGVTSRGP